MNRYDKAYFIFLALLLLVGLPCAWCSGEHNRIKLEQERMHKCQEQWPETTMTEHNECYNLLGQFK